jgi:hypothetical protein
MQTDNIQPDQRTWTLVATDPGYIRIKSNALSGSRWWCVAVTTGGEPAEEVTGEKYLGNELFECSGVIGEVYIFTERSDDDFAITTGTFPGGESDTTTTDRELVTTTYRVAIDFDDSSVGDVVTLVQILDVSGSVASTVTTVWRNQTTGVDFVSAPSISNLELVGSLGLSNAQLRATAVQIVEKDDPFTIQGRTPDNANDVVYDYADGTSETFFFTTDGDLAGKGVRE